MTLQSNLALIMFLLPLAYSPGPGNLFFAANGACFGFRATIAANLGYHLATWIVTFAIGMGFAAILAQGPGLFAALKWAGAAYMLVLAARMIRAGAPGKAPPPRPAGFADGAVLLVLNPKAYAIIALMFSQFPGRTGADAATGTADARVIGWIAMLFTLNNLLAFSLWALAGDRLAALFANAVAARRLNLLFGALMAGAALWMLAG